MSRILIVSALKQELFDIDNVLYTGVGKVNATYKLTELLTRVYGKDRFDLVINYGTAASKVHSGLVDCTKFIQRDMDVTPLGFKKGETPFESDPPFVIQAQHQVFNPINRNATSGTGDKFAEDKSQYYGEVVDMEAYALAKVCTYYAVPFISFKYITDGADEQAHEDWELNLADGIKEFKKVLDLY